MQGINTKEDVKKICKDMNVSYIRMWFTDLLGQVKSFALTMNELENAFENGMGFDGSSITGYQDIEESDMIAMPDPTTFELVPWSASELPEGRMICDILTPEGEPYAGDPRNVLRLAMKRATDMGYEHFFVGPELEYFYLDKKTMQPLDKGGYFDLTTLDVAGNLRRETVDMLIKMGFVIEYSHHELGHSQHEIDMRYGDVMTMADQVITYRVLVKKVANRHGAYATFMPKPIFGQPGSGMHVHQSLFKGNKNCFFDPTDEFNLSREAKCFVAGQLNHASEMSAIFAQWVNSYKRLVPGYEAPVYIAWSRRNRSALIRVPMYHPGKENATRIEMRCPDPACNPYLTFAVMLHAGLDGIEKGYEISPPMETNLYHLTASERKELGIKSLPNNLGEAVNILEQSELVRRALGDHVFSRFVELKKQEWENYRIQVTQYEIDNLLPIL